MNPVRYATPLVFFIWLWTAHGHVFAEEAPDVGPGEETEASDAIESQRHEIAQLAPALRPDAPWLQVGTGLSIYDSHRELLSPQLTGIVSGGYRWNIWGVLGQIGVDRNWAFSRQVATLSTFRFGLGVEAMAFMGRVRCMLAVGATVLISDTVVDSPGTMGWYVDLRPSSVRWPIFDDMAIEFTPLSFGLTVPVTDGIPIILISYLTRVGFEWSL